MEMIDSQHFTVHMNCLLPIIDLRSMQPHYLRANHGVATSYCKIFLFPLNIPCCTVSRYVQLEPAKFSCDDRKYTLRLFNYNPFPKPNFSHVDDVDLFVAGVAETHLPGAAVGPTFGCIIAKNFQRIMHGDRFWFERPDSKLGFTLGKTCMFEYSNLDSKRMNYLKDFHFD